MKKTSVSLILASSVLLLAACGQETADIAEERVIPVNTQLVKLGDIATHFSYTAVAVAAEHIAVMPRLGGGMVQGVYAEVGDRVEAGDILFTLDPVDIQSNIDNLMAQLAVAEAGIAAAQTGVTQAQRGSQLNQNILQAEGAVNQARTGVAQASGGVTQARAGLSSAEVAVEQTRLSINQAQNGYNTARQNFEDTTVLFAVGGASGFQLDQAELGLANAEIALEQAQAQYQNAQLGLEQARVVYDNALASHNQALAGYEQAMASYDIVVNSMPEEIQRQAGDGLAQATAQRNSIQVNLNAALERLEDVTVRAPIGGVIAARGVEPNTMMGGGTAPFTIVSDDLTVIATQVTGSVINHIELGQAVEVFVRDVSERHFTGVVTLVAPAADHTGTFAVEVTVTQANEIRPGMFAEVSFPRDQAVDTVVIPRQAVVLEQGEPVVFVSHGVFAVSQPVEVGIDNGEAVQILSGVSMGDEIVVTGQQFLVDGVGIVVIDRE